VKITEYSIRRYGPLRDSGKVILKDFNLFYGQNEEGKTLTIDALVKLLMGKNFEDAFTNLERVEETPDGYVIISDHEGNETKTPENGNLTEVAELTASECNNIFIVRNSNLSIARDANFYTRVTDRLTGLRTEEITRIINRLRETGKITPTGDLRNIKQEKLKTRIKKAESLIEEITPLKAEIAEKGYQSYQENLAKLAEKIDQTESEIEDLEIADKREKYERARNALDKLQTDRSQLKDLEPYDDDDEQKWRDNERDIELYLKEKSEVMDELEEVMKKREQKEEKLKESESNFEILENRKSDIDDIKLRLNNYIDKNSELVRKEKKEKFLKKLAVTSAILLGISLLGIIFSDPVLFAIAAGMFLIISIVSTISEFKICKRRSSLAGLLEDIRLDLSKYELDAKGVEDILSNIQRFSENYSRNSERLQRIKREWENLRDKIDELENKRIPSIENKINHAREAIEKIKSESKEESLRDYTKKLKLKNRLVRETGEQSSSLISLLGKESEQLEDNIIFWNRELEKLEVYKDKAGNVKPDEDKLIEIKNKKDEYTDTLRQTRDQMKSIKEKMEEVERNTNEIFKDRDEHLPCQTVVDLEAIEYELQQFIQLNERRRENALEAIAIFEEISKEKKTKVSQLFGEKSPVSKYFHDISGGFYQEVTFNWETDEIEVRRRDQKILNAEKLSGGAYDQLYFSIRLSLGEELLKGEKGFFILDDPFIKADSTRLKKQIETLKRLVEKGWQIIYFSAKEEIIEALNEEIENKYINTIHAPGMIY
jgi:exonuclease SbcC